MKSTVETLESTKVKLSVEVSYAELEPAIKEAYKVIGSQISIPGFRKGKVPAAIIDQRIGKEAVLDQALNDAIPNFYRDAVVENEISPMASPAIDVTQVPLDGKDLHFTAEVSVRPTLELPVLEEITITVPAAEVSEDDVTKRVDQLRDRFGSLVGVDRPAADGDYVVLDLSAKVGDPEVDSVSGISYQLGTKNLLDGLDEALLGLSADEETTFETKLAGGEHAGEEAQVTVKATAVKVRELPELDDDFAQLASEFDTVEELLADLRTQAESEADSGRAVTARDSLLNTLLTTVEIPVPTDIVEDEVERHLAGEGREEDEVHRVGVREEATTALRNQILLDQLASELDVQISQEELLEYLIGASRRFGMAPNEFIQAVEEQGAISQMVGEVARSKALAVALRRVKLVDESGAEVDLSKFIGSDEDEQAAAEALVDAVAEAAEETGDQD